MVQGKRSKAKTIAKKPVEMATPAPNCSECEYKLKLPEGNPKWAESLMIRALISFFSLLVIGYNVTSGPSYFTSVFIFSTPFLFETYRVNPAHIIRKRIRTFLCFFSMLNIVVSVLGFFNILVLVNKILAESSYNWYIEISKEHLISGLFSFKLIYLYLFSCVPLLFFSFLDMVVNKSRMEDVIVKKVLTRVN